MEFKLKDDEYQGKTISKIGDTMVDTIITREFVLEHPDTTQLLVRLVDAWIYHHYLVESNGDWELIQEGELFNSIDKIISKIW
jgi:hypothetical protein